MESCFSEQLAALRESLTKLASLCAWRDLKREEAIYANPLILRLSDSTDEDIRAELGFFLRTATDLRASLPNSKLSRVQQSSIRKRLAEMQQRVRLVLKDETFKNQ